MKIGPKHFTTLEVTPCYRNNGIQKGIHHLDKGLEYVTTDAQYLSNGDLYFQLWDNEGWIGDYVIYKQHLNLIENNLVVSE